MNEGSGDAELCIHFVGRVMKVNEFDRFMKYIITFDKEYTKPIRVSITAYNISEYFTEEPSKHFVCIKNINFCFIYKDFLKKRFWRTIDVQPTLIRQIPLKMYLRNMVLFVLVQSRKKSSLLIIK